MKLFFSVCTICLCLSGEQSRDEYISGDAFKRCSQHVLDQTSNFKPEAVRCGDIIFVQLDYLERFFAHYHPAISTRYILISHNHDVSAPGIFKPYLEDPRLYAWFTQNMDTCHPKLYPIPIGLINLSHSFASGYYQILDTVRAQEPLSKQRLCYGNFNVSTNKQERGQVAALLWGCSWICWEKPVGYRAYLRHLAQSCFVLSPAGGGLDCYRTWETLIMGSFPVVRSSFLDSLYEGLPVLIVKQWEEVTCAFLEHKYTEMHHNTYTYEKLFFHYWEVLVRSKQDECRRASNTILRAQ